MSAGQNAALAESKRGASASSDEGVQPGHPARGVTTIVDADRGEVEFLMPDGVTPRKKFALVGFAGSTRAMAPFHDPEWAICGMNQLNRFIPRADFWYEVHKEWNTAVVPGTDHEGWLRDCGLPILMAERVPGLPTSIRIPIEPLIHSFIDYYTSTVAYMLAYTTWHIDRQVAKTLRETPFAEGSSALDVLELTRSLYSEYCIGIFGIDLIVGEEYEWQRPCAEFYLGQALARNITVMIPPQSALLKQRYRYGYQMEPDDLIKLSDYEKRKVELEKIQRNHTDQATALEGAIQELRYMTELYKLRERGGSVG
jgi:hypothetical protein